MHLDLIQPMRNLRVMHTYILLSAHLQQPSQDQSEEEQMDKAKTKGKSNEEARKWIGD